MTPLNLPKKLQHLQIYFEETSEIFKTAGWLISDFEAPIWEIRLGRVGSQFISWDVLLEDGTSLLATKNKDLLSGLKQYLIAATRNANDRIAETNSERNQRHNFNHASHIIDYLLINAEHFRLGKLGLGGLYGSRLIGILKKVADTRTVDEFFDWEQRVGAFARKLISTTPKDVLLKSLGEVPGINIVSPSQLENCQLGLSPDEIPLARAALYTHGYLTKRACWQPDSVKLASQVFKDTVFMLSLTRAKIEALEFGTTRNDEWREYPAAPLSTFDEEGVLPARFTTYRQLLYTFGALHEVGVPAPAVEDLSEALSYEPKLGTEGRYHTLPSHVSLGALKNAIEFHLKHGEHLIDSFCLLALHCVKQEKPFNHFAPEILSEIICKSTLELGVTYPYLLLNPETRHKDVYFNELRENKGLIELVRVYIGAVQIVVGALMGRRSGELIDLQTLTCLDETETWLKFLNRKSTKGARGIRRLESRPIEPIAVQMIKNLIRMQKELLRIGFIKEIKHLFACPSNRRSAGFQECTRAMFNRNLDYFCDYFETPLNSKSQRYYIRQHQFRRFFALLFFHTNSFGGLETLQWMLAHTSMSHIWNYITASTNGAVLRGAEAQYLSENIVSYDNLAAIIKKRYGGLNPMLVDAEELEDKILELMEDDTITVEVDFFEDENGEQMNIVVKETPKK